MDDLESKMGAVLSNPEMMQKIMELAQSFNPPSAEPAPPPREEENTGFNMPELDFATIQKLSGFLGASRIDSNQQTLLRALSPYLSNQRIAKLEKAMRAAKMANMASSLLGSPIVQSFLGR